ncbi:MAG TPA: carboxypeptidase regulatory-like domain-containing protein, partial [Chitinophagaceae bacterium]
MRTIILAFLLGIATRSLSQQPVTGRLVSGGRPVVAATVTLLPGKHSAITDSSGLFQFKLGNGRYQLHIAALGFPRQVETLLVEGKPVQLEINIESAENELSEVVVTGTMREVSKAASAVPVEVYTPKFFQKAAPVNLFEAVGQVNGVKPQLNCNVCNTGDIHINGMEGPYTQVLIDGMPIVSGLATVYGL